MEADLAQAFLTGLTITLGVVLADWLTRTRERRRSLVAAVTELNKTLIAVRVLDRLHDDTEVTRQRMTDTFLSLPHLLYEIRANAAWPTRHRKRIVILAAAIVNQVMSDNEQDRRNYHTLIESLNEIVLPRK